MKVILNAYITAKALVNPQKQQLIDIDEFLDGVLSSGKGSNAVPESMKREDLLKRLVDKMQPWHRIEVDGKDPVIK